MSATMGASSDDTGISGSPLTAAPDVVRATPGCRDDSCPPGVAALSGPAGRARAVRERPPRLPTDHLMSRLLLIALLILPSLAFPAPGDDDFLAAREAVRSGDSATLARLAPELENHPLHPYVELWLLRPRLKDLPEEDVQAYLNRYEGQFVANKLRTEWLRALGQAQRWALFERYWPGIQNPDTELRCFAIRADAARDPATLVSNRSLWFSGKDLPAACDPVFDAMIARGVLKERDLWARLRLALQTGNTTLAKDVGGRLRAWRAADSRRLDRAARNPSRYFRHGHIPARSRGEREVALYALGRITQDGAEDAAARWHREAGRFPRDEREYGWLLVALAGARQHSPRSLEWFHQAGSTPLDDSQLEWRARAALRAENWKELLRTIGHMDADTREQSVWRYWMARALRETGRESDAMPIFATLASEHDFHAELASEEMGPSLSASPLSYKPSEDEVTAAASRPGLQRALALYRLGLRYQGNLEWIWAVRDMDDANLIAAAELARREGWWERAIATAERTRSLTNMDLRYPTPYEELLRASAREYDVDEAWVYGLVRQESRFNASARSSVGASGLMQLMPATARWIARQLGITQWRDAIADAPDANVNFGTYYLKRMLNQLDGSAVLASAAYNAGPRRAENWRASVPLEGAIYIDTIPFTETRGYVRKVMANAVQYARRFGRHMETLTQRLGIVPARDSGRQ
ncbi:MAG: transglycosylase SLT domain-containing protein [Betaproteobacteria bacterium]|nr:transglycosylase SLT domain-containing protein [Betaproteobacteria bacterium]